MNRPYKRLAAGLSGKQKVLADLREQADDLREWMYNHTSPDVKASEFEVTANRYAVICTRISIIEKMW